jgi:hypothetical protein
LVQEGNSRFAWRWGDNAGLDCPGRLDTKEGYIKGWHGRNWFFTANFCDGHASTIKMQGCIWPPPNLGTTYPYVNADPSLSYRCFQCVTIRGDQWQLDTLPSPSVPTPFDRP